jgi:hypothetical protein
MECLLGNVRMHESSRALVLHSGFYSPFVFHVHCPWVPLEGLDSPAAQDRLRGNIHAQIQACT